jgi:protein subunit release factor A
MEKKPRLEVINEINKSEVKKVFIDEFKNDPNFILEEILKIQHSITHLQRSNLEMKDFDPEMKDKDFEEAIKENIIVIEKKEKEIENLKKLLPTDQQDELEDSLGIEL